jgi:hypothetical protein
MSVIQERVVAAGRGVEAERDLAESASEFYVLDQATKGRRVEVGCAGATAGPGPRSPDCSCSKGCHRAALWAVSAAAIASRRSSLRSRRPSSAASLANASDHLKGTSIPIGIMTSGFPSRLMRLPAVPHDAAMHSTHPEMGHGLRCPPDNVHETGVSSGGPSGSPIVAAEAEQVEQLEERPGHGSRSEVFVPFRPSSATGSPATSSWTGSG